MKKKLVYMIWKDGFWLPHVCCFYSQKERKVLEGKRLDLDAAKGRLRKAKAQAAQQAVSTGYLSQCHWLPPLGFDTVKRYWYWYRYCFKKYRIVRLFLNPYAAGG